MKNFIVILILSLVSSLIYAQQGDFIDNLNNIDTLNDWALHNRKIEIDSAVHFNAQPGNGILWLRDYNFSDGTIDVEIQGKNDPGRSFVGVAFHGLNDTTFDAVYFRAFNFKNPERSDKSVQYISEPLHTWYSLREQFPGKYESALSPVPEPEEWFQVTIEVNYPAVKVFVNNSDIPSLVVEQLSEQRKGNIGLWVGHNSKGSFRNLKVTSTKKH